MESLTTAIAESPPKTLSIFESFAKDLVAGTCAGITSTIFGHPLDTIKMRMQISKENLKMSSCIKQMYKQEGLPIFFKGITSPIVGNAPILALIFAGNQLSKRVLTHFQMNESLKVFLSGGIAGGFSLIIFVPVELTKVKVQSSQVASIQYKTELQRIVRNEGLKGLYRGFSIQFWRDVPSYAIYFFVYHRMQKLQGLNPNFQYDTNDKSILLKKLISGGIAGQLSWFAAYPFDIIKTQIQSNEQRLSIKQATRNLIDQHGYRTLYKGLFPCLLRAFPVSGIQLVTYEYISHFLTRLYLNQN